MTYDVLKDFKDEDFKVTVTGEDEKQPLSRVAGEKFIPAEVNYPTEKVQKLVNDGTLKLVTPKRDEGGSRPAKKK